MDQENAARFAELERDIRRIDIDAETIELTYHLRKFAELFQSYIVDDRTLSDLFTYLNRAALDDNKFAINMAVVFASRQLDDLVIKETKLRNAMLTILQQNFQSIDSLKHEGVWRFYNSITLLGEYYHRKKFSNGKRIMILGQSLLLLLTTELESEIRKCEESSAYTIDPEFAKVILTQVTLNGGEAKTEHRQEIDDLNYSIRKCLINVGGMSSRAKAYLLMTLDLFYTNFNLGQKLLEKLYGKYLFEPDENTSTKKEEKGSEEPAAGVKKEETPVKPESNSTAGEAGTKSVPKKPTEKTDQSRKQRNTKPAPSKPRRKEDTKPEPPAVSSSKHPPSTPPKKSPPTRVRPALNHTSPRKDQQQRSAVRTPTNTTTPKSPLQRRTPPEKLKQLPSGQKTPPPNPSVLKQNCKGTVHTKNHSTSPASNNTSNASNSPGSGHGNAGLKLQMPGTGGGTGTGLGVGHDDNVENLAWDDLTLEDESPQKINPHTKSFLSFLAQK